MARCCPRLPSSVLTKKSASLSAAPHRRVHSSSYVQILHRLQSCPRGVNQDLTPCRLLIEACRKEHADLLWRDRPAVHVTGSNGKGTVVRALADTLHAHNVRVGSFSSPHLFSIRERVEIGQSPLSEEKMSQFISRIFECADKHGMAGRCTAFEIVSCAALLAFHEEQCSIIVVEVGLGGASDATTLLLPQPTVCVITSITLEHTAILGSSVEAIAREKAGIIKPNSHCIVGPSVPTRIIAEHVKEQQHATFQQVPACSDIQKENECIVRATLKHLAQMFPHLFDRPFSEEIVRHCLQTRPLARLQLVTATESSLLSHHVSCILDVAHNPAALIQLLRTVQNMQTNTTRIVVALSNDKDLSTCLSLCMQYAMVLYLTQAKEHARAVPVTELLDIIDKHHLRSRFPHCVVEVIEEGDVRASVRDAVNQSSLNEETSIICICGTFFIQREAFEALELQFPLEPDPINLNEQSLDTLPSPLQSAVSTAASREVAEQDTNQDLSITWVQILSLYRQMRRLSKFQPNPIAADLETKQLFAKIKASPTNSAEQKQYFTTILDELALWKIRTPAHVWKRFQCGDINKHNSNGSNEKKIIKPNSNVLSPRQSQAITEQDIRRHYALQERICFRGPARRRK